MFSDSQTNGLLAVLLLVMGTASLGCEKQPLSTSAAQNEGANRTPKPASDLSSSPDAPRDRPTVPDPGWQVQLQGKHEIVDRDGQTRLKLVPQLVTRTTPDPRASRGESVVRPFEVQRTTTSEDGTWVLFATAKTEWATYRYRIESMRSDAGFDFSLVIRYSKPIWVVHEALRFTVAADGDLWTFQQDFQSVPLRTVASSSFGHPILQVKSPSGAISVHGQAGVEFFTPHPTPAQSEVDLVHYDAAKSTPKTEGLGTNPKAVASPAPKKQNPGEYGSVRGTWVTGPFHPAGISYLPRNSTCIAASDRPTRVPAGSKSSSPWCDDGTTTSGATPHVPWPTDEKGALHFFEMRRNLILEHRPEGVIHLRNRNGSTVAGLSLHLPPAVEAVAVESGPPLTQSEDKVWTDLPSRTEWILRLQKDDKPFRVIEWPRLPLSGAHARGAHR